MLVMVALPRFLEVTRNQPDGALPNNSAAQDPWQSPESWRGRMTQASISR
jgi:hypothetical protein